MNQRARVLKGIHPLQHACAAGVVLVIASLAGACGDERGATRGTDLAARCERAVQAATPRPVRDAALRFSPNVVIGDEQRSPLGRVVGAVWHPVARRLYVLDAYNGGVAVFDSAGRRLSSFGRLGGGPGEFEELGGSHGARPVYNQLALLDNGQLGVMELGRLHVFTPDGRFVQRLRVTESDPGPYAVLHVAGFADGVLFSESGAMHLASDDPGERTVLRLTRASLRAAEIDTATLGTIRNNLHRMPPFTGLPPSDPYLAYYRRTWDAVASGLLVVPSQFVSGVCFFDSGLRLLAAHRVDAEPIQVDRTERQRVLNAFRAAAGPAPPLGARRWEDQYPSWPKTVPPYADVALAPDSVAWLLRPLRGGATVTDLVHARRGYIGSLAPPGGRLPLTFKDGCPYVIEERISSVVEDGRSAYGLRRWCPR